MKKIFMWVPWAKKSWRSAALEGAEAVDIVSVMTFASSFTRQ